MIKNIFLYLTAFITLGYDVWHFLSVIFSAIDKKIPDILDSTYNYYSSYANDSFRFSVASLIVMFPLYVLVSWYINRQIEKNKMDAESKIRHAMIWATMLITVLSIAGSLVSIIYNYLGGELSNRFVYKALSVTLVSIVIGVYYYYTLNRDYKIKTNTPVVVGTLALVAVLLICIYCISIVDSPAMARNKKLDENSLSNLHEIEYAISIYQTEKGSLPDDIKYITASFSQSFNPDVIYFPEAIADSYTLDPNTNKVYKYKVIKNGVAIKNGTATSTYELCPMFVSEMAQKNDPYSNKTYNYNMNPHTSHKIGEMCYKVTLEITRDNNNKIIIPKINNDGGY